MNLKRQTTSLCSTCYREIPAVVSVSPEGVFITKTCPAHGEKRSMLERDPVFYTYISGLRSPSIYPTYFVDVTRTCNLRCHYCYYPLEKQDIAGMFTVESIVAECAVNAHRAPFCLTGGEPTLHPEFPRLIRELQKVGPVQTLTNGVKLADREFFDEVIPLLTNAEGVAAINLSIHPETEKWRDFLEHCRDERVKVNSILIVVDSKEQFEAAVATAREYQDCTLGFRIKAASRLWNEQKPQEKIFVSDMVKWLEETGKELDYIFVKESQNKPMIVNTMFDGIYLLLVSWHDTDNVDLQEINSEPSYRARNGGIYNLVTTNLINEGMAKGWLAGHKIPVIK